MSLNEADTRAKLVDPKLHETWEETLISREYPVSKGRIDVIGDSHQRTKPKKIDYVLRYAAGGDTIAVVEAKEESATALSGMSPAKDYAQLLGVQFAYATNGHEIEEYDFLSHAQKTISAFPRLENLRKRIESSALKMDENREWRRALLETPYCSIPGQILRYYQETAIQRALDVIVSGRKRVLLTLATGSGKTTIAAQIAWKLSKAKIARRVLFLADRKFLRDQAHDKAFAPFGDARDFIEEGEAPKTRDVYFSIYQALYSGAENNRLYQQYPRDFFDLIIIDECHRSGYGSWKEILNHFSGAIHLGMTATPKRTDNVDTYAYFGEPVYIYSFGQGVQDGYLAPYLVHRTLTNLDKEGKLNIEDARTQGAEVIYAADEEIKDVYEQKEFEKSITLPDRTATIAEDIARKLKLYGVNHRTMIFCVDSDHADLMATEIQNILGPELGVDNYAVSIIARNNDIRIAEYERFKDSEKTYPVVATTVDLLTTGVDVPSVRNLVIVKPISSKIVFKQIVGRGARIDELAGKYFFRIFDYVNATRLFDDWERLPEPPPEEETGPEDHFLSGVVADAESQKPIGDATVTVHIARNKQERMKTDANGRFSFSNLPHKEVSLFARATDYRERQISVATLPHQEETIVIELKKKGKKPTKVLVRGLPVHIEEEESIVLEKDGKTLKVQEYISYAKDGVAKRAASIDDLRAIWTDRERREAFLREMREQSIYPEVLAELQKLPEADTFDLLAHVAFGTIPLTRDERAEALQNRERQLLQSFNEDARDVLFALLERYRLGGVEEMTNPRVYELRPFDQMGYVTGVAKRFGGPEKLRDAIGTFVQKLYPSAS